MTKLIDITGEEFGRWTVLGRDHDKKGTAHWLCRCECGNYAIVERANLKRKNGTQSCGCLVKFKYGVANMRQVINNYKRHAKRRGLEYNLTEKQFKKITKENCFYCGAKPNNISDRKMNNGEYIFNGIDRLNNNKGYIIDNVVPCCFICNRAKDTHTLQEFKEWVCRIYNKMYGAS